MAAIAERLRDGLLEAADLSLAADVASHLINTVNDELNGRADPSHRGRLTVAESLVARALIARGILIVAGDWWAELAQDGGRGAPAPEYHKALRTILDDLPAELGDGLIDTRTGKER